MKPTLAVDFDGTICDHEFPECGKLKEGAKEALDILSQRFRIVISSCRNNIVLNQSRVNVSHYLGLMKKYLEDNQIPFDEIDDGMQGKIVADIYIDDRAVSFTSWKDVLGQLRA